MMMYTEQSHVYMHVMYVHIICNHNNKVTVSRLSIKSLKA